MLYPYLTSLHGILYDSDCLEVMDQLKSETVDCIFADPPFNLGKDYKNKYNDKISQEEYYEWCSKWIKECCRILKPGGAFFLYALPDIAVRFAGFLHDRLTFRHWISLSMKGTFPRGKKLYPAHYALLYYTRGEPKTFNRVRVPIPTCRHCGKEIKDYGGHRNKLNPEGLNLTDFWEDTSPNRHKKYKVRSGVNELKLMIPERAILISTDPGDIVFDPFGGGGTTYQAAEEHQRYWIGSELYDCHHIYTRLKQRYPFSVTRDPKFNYESLLKDEDYSDKVLRRLKRKSM
ncbi:MAG: site-specific DNA-methyltransferase [Planctomycetes bacterium]|nr:site-specific DNA-methyltransferase [Planctomycetota bacterium]MBI5741458.1 site-specific DNA-methyltransferase [Nitrospirota bacterium]